jgi:6-pyruvoyltetrahydropterin/6-carboxytetrahydropterin synthase
MQKTKYVIGKHFDFSASHQLHGLPDNHQCSRLHGHNYKIKVVIGNDELDATGFVIDYGELKVVREFIDRELEHKHLNDVLPFNPTAENMAKYFYDTFSLMFREHEFNCKLIEVTVTETDKTFATYHAT